MDALTQEVDKAGVHHVTHGQVNRDCSEVRSGK